jgi:hypothetical protein
LSEKRFIAATPCNASLTAADWEERGGEGEIGGSERGKERVLDNLPKMLYRTPNPEPRTPMP